MVLMVGVGGHAYSSVLRECLTTRAATGCIYRQGVPRCRLQRAMNCSRLEKVSKLEIWHSVCQRAASGVKSGKQAQTGSLTHIYRK